MCGRPRLGQSEAIGTSQTANTEKVVCKEAGVKADRPPWVFRSHGDAR